MSGGGRRAAAVVAVAVMVGAAVLVRGWINGDDDGKKRGSGPTGDGRPTLLCAAELGDVCDAISNREDVDVEIEPAATSAARLETAADPADVEYDGWLTIAPQTGIVNDAQERNQLEPFFGPDEKLARSPLVFVAWKERLPKLTDRCAPASGLNWTCLADVATTPWSEIGGDEQWGRVKLGHADPARNTVGLLSLGQEATSKLQRTDISNADVNDDDFSTWFDNLEQNEERDDGEGPLAPMLRFGLGVDVAQVTEADACTAFRTAARAKDLATVVPTPVVTADVVFAPIRTHDADAVREAATGDTARAALADRGWRVVGHDDRRAVCDRVGTVRLDRSANLPGPGTLAALRDLRGSG